MKQRSTKLTLEEFIERSRINHDDKYDYSKSVYLGKDKKIEIVCPSHGSFWQVAKDHYGSHASGCKKCAANQRGKNSRLTREQFISKCEEIHGKDRYNYSKIEYITSDSVLEIICNKCGTTFIQGASDHRNGYGCQTCGREATVSSRKKTREWFIQESERVHGDSFNYDKVIFKNTSTKVTIGCNTCGNDFNQLSGNHIYSKHGCPYCSGNMKKTLKQFKREASSLHKNFYDYFLITNYEGNKQLVEVLCPYHGSFVQQIGSHLRGNGCDLCAREENNIANRLNKKTPATLYYVKLLKDGKTYYKIGVTSKSVEKRFKMDTENGVEVITLCQEYFKIGGEAYMKERDILKAYRDYKAKETVLISGGNTEIFSRDILNLDN